ncbi:Glycerol kinase [Elusimicrobium minutum Pei191]|uniref:Glycerol kinase n=1 Tax=Elusimicrobium minutum (strain Pei191) TaxID=445932 RepID=B2KDM6_ELUMP|nr:FGGY family carbohydrate kinase [Elusimicrobium minutum]ACC98622.1 Glycerol kinase [Elusimicrobium minutum Pei191]
MNTEKNYLVLDQGSSGSRVFIVNAEGKTLHKKYRELTPKHLGLNLAEYDGEELLLQQFNLLEEIMQQNPGGKIKSMAVSSQRSTIVLWDKNTGKTLCPVLTWQDGRGAEYANKVKMSQEEIHAKTGLYKTPFYSASKITWCLNNYPQAKKAAEEGALLIAPVATFVIWHLTGKKVFAVDPTLAQRTLLFNINTFTWDDDLIAAFNIPKNALPEIKNTVDNYGSYKGIPIKVCVGDQQSAAIGIGSEKEGDAIINYGTGAFLLVNTDKNLKSIPGLLTSVGPSTKTNPKNFMLEGPVNAASAIFQWLNSVGINFDLNDIDDIYQRSKNPVYFLPAFGGIGAPYWDFETPTVMAGFTTASKKEDIIAGGVNSLVFMLADIAFYIQKANVKIDNVKVSGGFAKNHSLLQFQADILNTKLTQTCENETTAMGAVCLMAKEDGVDVSSWEIFNAHRVINPQITALEAMDLYQKWHRFFDWCRSFKK